eukprot:TRINITY_DN11319_c0_g1_i1.p1 TRINITY_DN11319_c0_g1~~TRINITY_DN11319_c0_g1_i1.p1  ORF type:complete len:118 (+),score=12.04 TRINITY_DN11319_c0_g1_i1:93-446(+)
MNLDLSLITNFLFNKELSNLSSLITLQLDHITCFFILHNRSITAELLLKHLENTLHVILFVDSLYCCYALASVTLLNTDVNVFDVGSLGSLISVLERIECFKIFNSFCLLVVTQGWC